MENDNPQNNLIPNPNENQNQQNNDENENQAHGNDERGFFERISSKDVLVISSDLFPSIIFVLLKITLDWIYSG
jgi:hypothetical protein